MCFEGVGGGVGAIFTTQYSLKERIYRVDMYMLYDDDALTLLYVYIYTTCFLLCIYKIITTPVGWRWGGGVASVVRWLIVETGGRATRYKQSSSSLIIQEHWKRNQNIIKSHRLAPRRRRRRHNTPQGVYYYCELYVYRYKHLVGC